MQGLAALDPAPKGRGQRRGHLGRALAGAGPPGRGLGRGGVKVGAGCPPRETHGTGSGVSPSGRAPNPARVGERVGDIVGLEFARGGVTETGLVPGRDGVGQGRPEACSKEERVAGARSAPGGAGSEPVSSPSRALGTVRSRGPSRPKGF